MNNPDWRDRLSERDYIPGYDDGEEPKSKTNYENRSVNDEVEYDEEADSLLAETL